MLMVGVARVGNDPVARYTPDGKPVMDISLAFDYGRKGNDGRRPTQWVNATMWGERVERLQPYLSKGSQVFVTLSEPHIETYEKKDGSGQGFSLRARVTELEFVGGRREEPAGESSDAPAAAPTRPAKSAAKAPGFDDLDDDIPF
ncbi:MAG: single-stranded DNA-binding protein [Betaproteobacteria bacterium]|nr:single-stranded DNA-binding protein [Betaproteobacteria bacterium]